MEIPARSLRSKIIGLSVALVVVAGTILAWIAVRSSRASLNVVVEQQLSEVAHTAAQRLVETLEVQRNNVRRQARAPVLQLVTEESRSAEISRYLVDIKESEGEFLDLLATNASGTVVGSSDPSSIGKMLVSEKWVKLALAGHRAIAGPYESAKYGGRILYLSAPITGRGGAVVGVHAVVYGWRRASETLESLRQTIVRDIRVDLLVVTELGRVMVALGRDEVRTLLGTDLPLASPTAGDDGTSRPVLPFDVPVLTGSAQLSRFRSRWIVLAMRPTSEALAPLAAMQRQMLGALSAVLLVGICIAWMLSSRMVRPLQELTMATRLLGESGGDAPSVPARTHDEIGQLARAFNQMSGELKRARAELVASAKLAFAGEVAAGIAHEVRNPLSVVRGSAQILRRSVAMGKSGEELVDMIIGEVDRLNRVVGGLVEVAKPRTPEVTAANLGELVRRAKDFLAYRADERDIGIVLDLDEDLPQVRCDSDEIYQVVLNLTLNAIQMVDDGGSIVLRTARSGQGKVLLEVVDDGPGIDEEVAEQVFSPFFTMRGGGTGLGLAMVWRIVELHRGRVWVTSRLGRGSTFRVELPIAGARL